MYDRSRRGGLETARLCEVCSKLDIERLTHPLHPCSEPLPCRRPPINQHGTYLALGPIDDIKRRRFTCDVCKLVADCLDKEPEDLDGECRMTEVDDFCNFDLPPEIKTRDPSVTHFHLAKAAIIFDTSMANQFQGPSLPWELKTRYTKSTHCILEFQAKSRSCVESGQTILNPKTEEEILDTIGGRYVGTQVNAELIRAWLRQCENEHGEECVPPLRLPPDLDRQPTFVVDVVQSCLVVTPPRCRYVALSYVWGTAPVFKHLLRNTQDIRKEGSLDSSPIPATIRDSIILVRAIGERYLWVDSICIIQDDLKMQQEEIMRMAAIYSKALFTIIAAAGDNADSGLPGVRPESREQAQSVLKLGDCELLTVIDTRKTPVGINETVWAQRAWTFQERILSNRVLVFSENQAYWSCRKASHSEERALEQARKLVRRELAFPQRPLGDWFSWEPLHPLDYCDTYNFLLSNYRQRRLTYQSDQLNAFNGVSQILAAIQNDTFLWGLPESLFACAMSWFFTGYTIRNHAEIPILQNDGSKQMVPFPSWSWAAWSGKDPNNLLSLNAGDRERGRPVTDFYIVDKHHQLVKIKERTWEDETTYSIDVRVMWQSQQRPHSPPTLSHYPLPRMGQLYFWTSFANAKTIRSRRFLGEDQNQHYYILLPSHVDDPKLFPDTEIVYQDFIVVAARVPDKLILLAVEWKDGVAYRLEDAEVQERDWVQVENREWRLVILG